MSTELPDWIREGAKVAEYTYGVPGSVRLATVERLTATQIVLSGGHRYRRDTLREVGESGRGDTWSARTELRSPDDPQVVNARARRRLDLLRYKTEQIVRAAGNDVAAVLAALDDIEKLVQAARAAIQSPEG